MEPLAALKELRSTMGKKSAGLLVYRQGAGHLEVFLVHPGGPFWAKKDEGSWSIPKGEISEGENPLEAARREFEEETGVTMVGDYEAVDPVKQPSGKMVYVWLVRGELDPASIKSGQFSMEWPPRSGITQEFPEVDRGAWFAIDAARRKILKGQVPFLDQLERKLGSGQRIDAAEAGPGERRGRLRGGT